MDAWNDWMDVSPSSMVRMATRWRCTCAAASCPTRDARMISSHVEKIVPTTRLKIVMAIITSISVKAGRRGANVEGRGQNNFLATRAGARLSTFDFRPGIFIW